MYDFASFIRDAKSGKVLVICFWGFFFHHTEINSISDNEAILPQWCLIFLEPWCHGAKNQTPFKTETQTPLYLTNIPTFHFDFVQPRLQPCVSMLPPPTPTPLQLPPSVSLSLFWVAYFVLTHLLVIMESANVTDYYHPNPPKALICTLHKRGGGSTFKVATAPHTKHTPGCTPHHLWYISQLDIKGLLQGKMSVGFERVQTFFFSLYLHRSLSPPAFTGNRWIKAKWKWFFQKVLDVSLDLLIMPIHIVGHYVQLRKDNEHSESHGGGTRV